jgi:hypothetical protein
VLEPVKRDLSEYPLATGIRSNRLAGSYRDVGAVEADGA